MDNHHVRHVERANAAHDLLEELDVGEVVHTLAERNVRGEELANALTHLLQCSSSGKEVLLELMETHGEDAVGMEEGFLDSISMMHINIKVKHSRVNL